MDKTESATQDAANAFKPNGFVWTMLRESGDKYVYDAVKKGYSTDWQQRIPPYIFKGIDITDGTGLLERRSRWNEKTHDEFALPTEIWRETVERLQRCDNLIKKIADGEITSINDFITYNLDIRSFTEDVIRQTPDHSFVAHFYHALQNVSILDPTCGSGAFLFAALNILEPLYEACIDRMEEFNRSNPNLFKNELDAIKAKYSSNRQYFIYKSIILRNLYGVDIMVEATEIAKLRLFLKMVAVVDVDPRKDNLGLDPLPDIDFNIKCGNTLVGYATKAELDKDLQYGDMFAIKEFKEKIAAKMQIVASAYKLFRDEQLKPYDDNASIKAFKDDLRGRLAELNDLLNKHMHSKIARGTEYAKWEASHQPFHWLAEFYQIIQGNGGFDVIVGNPPYVKITSTGLPYVPSKTLKSSANCGDLFGYCLERFCFLSQNIGVIIPLSLTSTTKMSRLRDFVIDKSQFMWNAYYSASAQPSVLFEGVRHRLMTTIIRLGHEEKHMYSTDFLKWFVPERNNLFYCKLNYQENDIEIGMCKISNAKEYSILRGITKEQSIGSWVKSWGVPLYYHNAPVSWGKVFDFVPLYQVGNNPPVQSSHLKTIYTESKKYSQGLICVLNSTLFYWYNWQYSNCRDLSLANIYMMKLNKEESLLTILSILSDKLMVDYKAHSTIYNRTTNGQETKFDSFYPAKSKPIIDEIDKALAKHYNFTDEELDFIINYDIKYRMGDELNEN